MVTVLGCAWLATASICSAPDRAVTALDNATTAIETNSDAWRVTLTSLANQLDGIEKDLAAQVRQIALQAGNNVGDQARCTIAYTGAYVLDQLQALKARYLKKPVPAVNPVVCSTVPRDAVALDDVKSGRVKTVEFDGYHMDRGEFGLAIIDAKSNAVTPVPTIAINYNSPFTAVLDLAKFPIPDASASFVYYAHGQRYGNQSLAIQPTTQQQPPPVVTFGPLQVQFHTNDDDKDGDSVLSVVIQSFAGDQVSSWTQVGNLGFSDNSNSPNFPLTPALVDLTRLTDATLGICIAPNGHDTWRFNWSLTGTLHGGPLNGQSRTFSGNSKQVSEDVRCLTPAPVLFRPSEVAAAASVARHSVSAPARAGAH
jgi:hypothetical protein